MCCGAQTAVSDVVWKVRWQMRFVRSGVHNPNVINKNATGCLLDIAAHLCDGQQWIGASDQPHKVCDVRCHHGRARTDSVLVATTGSVYRLRDLCRRRKLNVRRGRVERSNAATAALPLLVCEKRRKDISGGCNNQVVRAENWCRFRARSQVLEQANPCRAQVADPTFVRSTDNHLPKMRASQTQETVNSSCDCQLQPQ